MTEPIGEPIPEPTTELEPDEPAGDDEQVLDMRAVRRLRTENQKLRHQLREAEENYGGAAARLAAAERREIERELASSLLIDPQDIWRSDTEVQQSFVDEQFREVIPDAVRDAAEAIIAAKPHLAKSTPPPSSQPIEGLRPGASPAEKPKPTSWAAAIRGI